MQNSPTIGTIDIAMDIFFIEADWIQGELDRP